jgi:hypothetical protein
VGHESYDRREDLRGPSNRVFGLVFAAVFLAIGLLPAFWGKSVHLWSLPISASFLLAALLIPSVLGPLNSLWLKFGLLLHRIVSPVVLGIMFFGVITPMGLVMRALGKDPLRLRREPEATTYWIDREPPGPAPESLRDQF